MAGLRRSLDTTRIVGTTVVSARDSISGNWSPFGPLYRTTSVPTRRRNESARR
jgi:hypothetical protein